MSYGFTPPPVTANIQVWAQNIVTYLQRVASRLQFKPASASATENGVILWDPAEGYPVVSKDGEWRQIILADGHAILGQDADITAAAANTAYKIALDAFLLDDITLTGSPLTEITFVEGGLYSLAFTAQISSSSSSTVNFRFWPRINGNDISSSTMVASLHNNGATIVVSRTAIFNIVAGDVLNVMWATDSTSGSLKAYAATAYAPAAPSVTLAISRINS
jgi:hypothetical protein